MLRSNVLLRGSVVNMVKNRLCQCFMWIEMHSTCLLRDQGHTQCVLVTDS